MANKPDKESENESGKLIGLDDQKIPDSETEGFVKSNDAHKKNYNNTQNNRHIFIILGGSCLLNCLLAILCGVTTVYMTSESAVTRADSNLCLNCSYIKLHPEDDLRKFSVYDDGTCCLRNGGNYLDMVSKLVDRTMKERLVSESRLYQPLHCDVDNRVPVIKMVGRLVNLPDTSSQRFHWLKWTKDLHRSDPEQLIYDDSFITVGKTGIYQIYSQLVMRKTTPKTVSSYYQSPNKYFLHAIYKYSSSGYDERILGGSYSYFENNDGNSTTTSYIGSPYPLIKGDIIGVKVHDVNQVVASNVTNFFGVHLIQ